MRKKFSIPDIQELINSELDNINSIENRLNKIIKDKLFEYRDIKKLNIIEIKCLNCGNIIDTKNKNRKSRNALWLNQLLGRTSLGRG